jgi:glutamate 5-kinase
MTREVVVVKVGTSTLVSRELSGAERLDAASFERIGSQINQLHSDGADVVLVTSAAITAGMIQTGLRKRPEELLAKKRLASLGAPAIFTAWSDVITAPSPSLLLTRHSLQIQHDDDELGPLLAYMLAERDVPLINENDAIASEEIRFGDNDTLSATVAIRIKKLGGEGGEAVSLVMLSDVEGVYADRSDPATRIPCIDDIAAYEQLAAGVDSPHGTGGMQTKFEAAKLATAAGIPTYIAHGRREMAIIDALQGKTGTKFAV